MVKNPIQTKIGLGTVQFGIPYGVNANIALMSKESVFDILSHSVTSGIEFFDTATSYGESENRLGCFIAQNKYIENKISISTKIPRVDKNIWNSSSYFEYIKSTAKMSLLNLNLNKHHLLQFHQCDLEYLESKFVHKAFQHLLDENICKEIGISVYTPEQALAALQIPCIKALQIPVNILDRRFITPSFIKIYKEKNIFIIARSILLQGILIPNNAIPNIKRNKEILELKMKCLNSVYEKNLQKIALDFIFNNLNNLNINIGLIGVNSVEELSTNISLIQSSSHLDSETDRMLMEIGYEAQTRSLLDPSLWNKV